MFVATTGPADAKVMLVGEAPGEWEDRTGKPFHSSAPAGRTLDMILRQANICRHEVLIANVARERPPGNEISFFFEDKACNSPKPIMRKWIELLRQEIIKFKPNIVIGLGGTALWALTGSKGITAARGYIQESSLVPGQKVLCTYHPQKVNYEWQLLFPTVMDIKKALAHSETRDIPTDRRALQAGVTRAEFIDYVSYLINEHSGPVAVDIEVANPGVFPSIFGIADSPEHAVSVEIVNGTSPRFSVEGELSLWRAVAELFDSKELIFQNGMFDVSVLFSHLGIFPRYFTRDTMIAAHVLWPEQPRSLAFLSSICLDVPIWKNTAQTMPLLYNAADAANTYGVWNMLEAELIKNDMMHTFDFEMKQVYPATFLHLNGIKVDTEKQKKLIKEITTEIGKIDSELEEAIGRKVNFNSPKQVKELLYGDMRLPEQYKRRKSIHEKRKVTTNKEALNKLFSATQNPILAQILEYKRLVKLLSFVDVETSPSGRVHTSYNITGATMARVKGKDLLVVDDDDSYKSFGRWSSSKSIVLPYGSGNLQNIPYEARKIYVVPEGKLLLQADYKQAEAVVVAYLIGDEPSKQLFKKSFGLSEAECKANFLDIHLLTGAVMFGVELADVTKEQRNIGKRIRHATNYSAGPAVLAASIGCTQAHAKGLLQRYYNVCPQLQLWHKQIQTELNRTRMLTNLLGRKHHFMGRWDESLFRSAYAYIPQSTVGDLLNLSLCKIYGDLEIALQLHDAVYCVVDEDKLEQSRNLMYERMLHELTCYNETFTIDVDFKVGLNWGEMVDYDTWIANGGRYECAKTG